MTTRKLLLRFNTDHKGTDLKWRCLIDGQEMLASEVVSSAPWVTTEDEVSVPDEHGWHPAKKHHITIEYTELVWRESRLIVYGPTTCNLCQNKIKRL